MQNRTNLQRETSHCAGSNPNIPRICPLDLSWTSWTSWTICSANCGVSYRQRTRSCVNGQYGGPQCAVPFEEEQKVCENRECPIDCLMGQWSPWSRCSSDCVDLKNGSYLFPQRFRTRPVVKKGNVEGLSCDQFQSKAHCLKIIQNVAFEIFFKFQVFKT